MLFKSSTHVVVVKSGGKIFRMEPDIAIELPNEIGERLLELMPDQVHAVEASTFPQLKDASEVIVEPAKCRPVYWQSDAGIIGPGQVEYLACDRHEDGTTSFWVCLSYQGHSRWVHESLLKSKQQHAAQCNGQVTQV